ncbi:histidine phosphatase family protein [Salibaculum griseiflavum]|jgi:broad specificity phosphatase PhoE|uniref:Histidine phosphatase family protein n=1 Tax=Salibaculum griseiflavum TaxID=1914409 RepID=A0A2V1P6Y1_9RHOB|nr:histidine phosphatase family protein [Salibaculum griseiflavum]PWG17558.1 histidine phosphatase family protein [Salibaculum griseiflavum]
MGEIVMVRHGQANTGATSEAEYDRLSQLGHRQAAWLGEWMQTHESPFDHVLTGTMRRHRETAEGMGVTADKADDRLNELDYFALARDIEITHGLPQPASEQDFAAHVPQTFAAWHAAEITGAEPFASFEDRIRTVLDEAAEPGRRVLCVTSGGVIAMALRLALDLDPERLAQVLLPIYNSSIHRFRVLDTGTYLSSFNAIPHLDSPDRADSRSWI